MYIIVIIGIHSVVIFESTRTLSDNILVKLSDVFSHNVGIPMSTNCALLLADLLISVFVPAQIYFILGHLTKNGKKLAKSLGL